MWQCHFESTTLPRAVFRNQNVPKDQEQCSWKCDSIPNKSRSQNVPKKQEQEPKWTWSNKFSSWRIFGNKQNVSNWTEHEQKVTQFPSAPEDIKGESCPVCSVYNSTSCWQQWFVTGDIITIIWTFLHCWILRTIQSPSVGDTGHRHRTSSREQNSGARISSEASCLQMCIS